MLDGSSWKPFIGPSQWNRVESVQNIGVRTITALATTVETSVLRKSTNFNSILRSNSVRRDVPRKIPTTITPWKNTLSTDRKTHNRTVRVNLDTNTERPSTSSSN